MKLYHLADLLTTRDTWIFLPTMFLSGTLYYLLFFRLIATSNYGIISVTVPYYLTFLLVWTAALVFSFSILSLWRNRLLIRTARDGSKGIIGSLTVILGGLSAGCSCQAPIIYSLLYFLGFNSILASSFVAILDKYQIPIFGGLVILNLFLILDLILRDQRIRHRFEKRRESNGVEYELSSRDEGAS